jgi:hypothetical protein
MRSNWIPRSAIRTRCKCRQLLGKRKVMYESKSARNPKAATNVVLPGGRCVGESFRANTKNNLKRVTRAGVAKVQLQRACSVVPGAVSTSRRGVPSRECHRVVRVANAALKMTGIIAPGVTAPVLLRKAVAPIRTNVILAVANTSVVAVL